MICQYYPHRDSTESDSYNGTGTAYIGDLYYKEKTYIKNETPEELNIIHNYNFLGIRTRQECCYAILITGIFNVCRQQYVYRCMFSKSGFLGRVAKRRKGV